MNRVGWQRPSGWTEIERGEVVSERRSSPCATFAGRSKGLGSLGRGSGVRVKDENRPEFRTTPVAKRKLHGPSDQGMALILTLLDDVGHTLERACSAGFDAVDVTNAACWR